MRHAKRFHLLKNHPAESLIETLVSITVIVISTTAALTVMRTALQGNQVIEKKIQAINLAEEGFEVLRNLRDTNYLLFSSDAENCWNKLNVSDVSECSTSSATRIRAGTTYYFVRDFTNEPYLNWSVVAGSGSNIGYLDLYEVDLDGDGSADTEMVAQRNVSNTDFDSIESRVFQRTFTVEYGDYDGDGTNDYYDATITVSWTEDGLVKSVTEVRRIANIY